MLPTPSTSHVNYNQIYEPAEDSFLLLDTLSSPTETEFLRARFRGDYPSPLVLEVGTGSGVVLAFITAQADRIFGRSDVATLGVDVNSFACAATRETVSLTVREATNGGAVPGLFLDSVASDLTATMKPRSVDILVFNPPYVPSGEAPRMPTSAQEEFFNTTFDQDTYLLSLSTDGGADGMETTNRLLGQLPDILSERGLAYILLSASNRPDQVVARIKAWTCVRNAEWKAERVASSGNKAGWEKLCVVRIWLSTS